MSRKRLAPDSSLSQTMQQGNGYGNVPAMGDASQMSDDQFIQWGANNDTSNRQMFGSNTFPSQANGRAAVGPTTDQLGGQYLAPSNQLVRRNPNQQLSRTGEFFTNQDITTVGDNGADNDSDESEGELERKAIAAKRDAQSRRPPKSIPPFIQKLSSFLDDTRNEDLIRWSDDGKTFIVLDEELFAKTLIPELFKHKNFASFVRQLNMYGFHKVLGLADNSMRASEKKSKNPSQYRHKYFRRGRPDLLWMVIKPKSEAQGPKKKKRKVEEEQDSDDDGDRQEDGDGAQSSTNASSRGPGAVTMPRQQWTTIQHELAQLKQSQQHINKMIARFQHENNQYIRQASAQHERHENSINAILTFLATFYNRSLENNDVGNMFGNAIPPGQPRRNVEDIGDYEESPGPQQTNFPIPMRRPQLLLGPPDSTGRQGQLGQAQTLNSPAPPSSTSQPQQQLLQPQSAGGFSNSRPQSNRSSNHSSPAEAVYDNFSDATLPQRQRYQQQQQQQQQQQPRTANHQAPAKPPTPTNNNEMMSMIHQANQNQNTSDSPNIDFSSALRHFENSNGNNPLTPEERNNMLSLMASTSGTSTPAAGAGANALFNPNALANNSATVNADYNQFLSNRESIAALQRLQQEQHDKVQALAGRLTPLSPSGSIPGFPLSGEQNTGNDLYGNNFGAPGDFDLNNYINQDYFPEYDGGLNFANDNGNSADMGDVGGLGDGTGFDAFNTQGGSELPAAAAGDAKSHIQATQPDAPGADDPSTLNDEDGSLFGSSNTGTPPRNDEVASTPADPGQLDNHDHNYNNHNHSINNHNNNNGEAASITRKTLGSATSSSGMHSPTVEEADDDEEGGAGGRRQARARAQARGNQRRSQRLRRS
ncbi:MAG: stress-responsive transcription factor hsf1 [Chrysothrix sp. TS-e1954]|nr:MAG: stress-responsive transcription factor hsf1 [Chrysothrix sp. TS-e1954]